MPDFAANQPAMLARLPLRAGLDWLVSRYASAKNTLDTHPWHHRLLLVEGRSALSVPVRPPTCRAITTEKREAHTAGLGVRRPVQQQRKPFFCPRFRPSPPRVGACTNGSPMLRRATSCSPPPSCPTAALYLFETPSLPAITPVTDRSHAYAGAVNLPSQP